MTHQEQWEILKEIAEHDIAWTGKVKFWGSSEKPNEYKTLEEVTEAYVRARLKNI